jgi:hypothetical protein
MGKVQVEGVCDGWMIGVEERYRQPPWPLLEDN